MRLMIDRKKKGPLPLPLVRNLDKVVDKVQLCPSQLQTYTRNRREQGVSKVWHAFPRYKLKHTTRKSNALRKCCLPSHAGAGLDFVFGCDGGNSETWMVNTLVSEHSF